MKNKDFDNIDKLAKDAFENFEVPLDAGDWMDFQQHLRAEKSVDQVAKDALAGYEVPLDPSGWDDFEKLRQSREKGAFYIWWYKAAELGALALLLLGTFFYLPCSQKNNTSSNTIAYGSTPTLNTTTDQSNNSAPSTANSILSTTGNDVEQAYTATDGDNPLAATSTQTAIGNYTTENNSTDIANSKNKAAQNDAGSSNINSNNASSVDASASVAYQATSTPEAKATRAEKSPSTAPLQKQEDSKQQGHFSTNDAVATSLAPLGNKSTQATDKTNSYNSIGNKWLARDYKNLQLTNPAGVGQSIEPITTFAKTELKAPHRCRHYLGAVLGVGANMQNSMGKTSIGYSGGVTYEKEFSSKLSLSTGLIASYKRYDRTDNILLDRQIDGKVYEMTQQKTSNLMVVELPLDLNYTCFRSDKWRINASLGLTANAIFSRIYTGSQEVQVDGLTISTQLNSSDFERGLVEGGEAGQNLYLSIGGGLSVERKLSDELSLYLSPTYRHGLNAVHSDFIHTFNVNIGIKKAL